MIDPRTGAIRLHGNAVWYLSLWRFSFFTGIGIMPLVIFMMALYDKWESKNFFVLLYMLSKLVCLYIIFPYLVLYFMIILYTLLLCKSYFAEFTDDHLAVKGGVLSVRREAIPYDRIQDVVIAQNLLARLLSVHTVLVQSAGEAAIVIPGLDGEDARRLRGAVLDRVRAATAAS